jgi:pyruvate kinase
MWMSRMRSGIPIYAFTRREATCGRVTLYRGVYPIFIDLTTAIAELNYTPIFVELLARKLVEVGDRIILTKGDLSGITGTTNMMKILEVRAS